MTGVLRFCPRLWVCQLMPSSLLFCFWLPFRFRQFLELYHQTESFSYGLVCRKCLAYLLARQNELGALLEPVRVLALNASLESFFTSPVRR